ncbi:hypothetical protein D3C85_898340 [compost metagenome]
MLSRWLKAGNEISSKAMAITTAINVSTIDSVKNWIINEVRFAPMVFLMPTSLALFSDLAVAMFMKLMQAIKRMPKARPTKR